MALILLTVSATLLAAYATIRREILRAPEGFEDRHGFHQVAAEPEPVSLGGNEPKRPAPSIHMEGLGSFAAR
jgi:hypothetical protein